MHSPTRKNPTTITGLTSSIIIFGIVLLKIQISHQEKPKPNTKGFNLMLTADWSKFLTRIRPAPEQVSCDASYHSTEPHLVETEKPVFAQTKLKLT